MKKQLKKLFLLLPLAMLLCSVTAFADAKPSIVSAKTNDDSISIFVKNSGGAAPDDCLVGSKQAAVTDMTVLSALNPGVQTLVLIDNSASISAEERTKIIALLSGYVSSLPAGEEMSIATFTNQITYLCDFTSDKNALNTCVNGITFQNQDAFLADVLYELLAGGFGDGDVYRRIIVISDGADNAPIGYTETEMNNMLQNSNVPVYSIGCTSKSGASLLQNMFSFSRMTQGTTYLLADYADVSEICASLMEDAGIVKYIVQPDADSMDGSEKPVQLTINGTKLNKDCRMPQVVKGDSTSAGTETADTDTASSEEENEEGESDDEDEDNKNISFIIIGAAVVAIVIIGYLVYKNKNKKSSGSSSSYNDYDSNENVDSDDEDEEGEDDMDDDPYADQHTSDFGKYTMYADNDEKTALADEVEKTTCFDRDSEVTEMIDTDIEKTEMIDEDCERTEMLTEDIIPAMPSVSLIDTDNPSKMFMFTLNGSVVVGRSAEKSDIVIDYDKTVSGAHFRLTYRDEKYYIETLSTTNSTRVDGQKIEDETEIAPGATISIGRVNLRFEEC